MREVVLLHICLVWIVHGRRTQSPRFQPQQNSFEERNSSSASRPTAAFTPSAGGARFSRFHRRAPVHVVGAEDWKDAGYLEPEDFGYHYKKVQIKNYTAEEVAKYLEDGITYGGWDNTEYLDSVKQYSPIPMDAKGDFRLCLMHARTHERRGSSPRPNVYLELQKLRANLTDAEIREVVEEVEAEVERRYLREQAPPAPPPPPPAIFSPPIPPANPPQAPVSTQGITTAGSYAELISGNRGAPTAGTHAQPVSWPPAPAPAPVPVSAPTAAQSFWPPAPAPAPVPVSAPTAGTPAWAVSSPPAPAPAPAPDPVSTPAAATPAWAAPPAPVPAPVPVSAPTASTPSQPVYSPLAENDPKVLRQKYKDYLRKCSQEGRQPRGAILDMMAQLVKDQPPTENEEADVKDIAQMERRFGLTIHTHLFSAAAPQLAPPQPPPPTEEASWLQAAAPQLAVPPPPPAAAPQPPAPAPPATAPQPPAAAADPQPGPKSGSQLRLQYKEYLSQCMEEGQRAQDGVLDMVTRLLEEMPPTQEEELNIREIARMERQLGLTIHTHLVQDNTAADLHTAAQPVSRPAPAVPQSAAAPAAPAAAPVADVAVLARNALERLTAARDLDALDASDRDALLTSLLSALMAVQRELGATVVPTVPVPAPAPVAPQAAAPVDLHSPAVFQLYPPVPAPAAVPVAPQADDTHKDHPYYVPGMEVMSVAEYRLALKRKLERYRHIYDPDASGDFSHGL